MMYYLQDRIVKLVENFAVVEGLLNCTKLLSMEKVLYKRSVKFVKNQYNVCTLLNTC